MNPFFTISLSDYIHLNTFKYLNKKNKFDAIYPNVEIELSSLCVWMVLMMRGEYYLWYYMYSKHQDLIY